MKAELKDFVSPPWLASRIRKFHKTIGPTVFYAGRTTDPVDTRTVFDTYIIHGNMQITDTEGGWVTDPNDTYAANEWPITGRVKFTIGPFGLQIEDSVQVHINGVTNFSTGIDDSYRTVDFYLATGKPGPGGDKIDIELGMIKYALPFDRPNAFYWWVMGISYTCYVQAKVKKRSFWSTFIGNG